MSVERPEAGEPATPPVTGEGGVDRAVAGLEELTELPLAEHHDRLTRAHEQLHAALSREPDRTDAT